MGQILCMSSYHLCIYAVTRRYKNPIKACFPVGGGWTVAPASYLRLNHHQILRIFIIFYTCMYRVVANQSVLCKICITDAVKNMCIKNNRKNVIFLLHNVLLYLRDIFFGVHPQYDKINFLRTHMCETTPIYKIIHIIFKIRRKIAFD